MTTVFIAFIYTLVIVGLMFIGGTITFFAWFAIKDSISTIIIKRNNEQENQR